MSVGASRRRVGILCGLLLASLVPVCNAASPAQPLVNRKAPEIAREDLNGARIDLKGLRGKVVLLNFWATWCGPCLLEMPVFSGWQQKYGPQGFQVIGISMDDDVGPVRILLAKLKPTYPIAMGDAKLGAKYGGVLGLPLSYLIDRNGVVHARFQGEAQVGAMEKKLKEMLAQP